VLTGIDSCAAYESVAAGFDQRAVERRRQTGGRKNKLGIFFEPKNPNGATPDHAARIAAHRRRGAQRHGPCTLGNKSQPAVRKG
jgi:hypothetical protein